MTRDPHLALVNPASPAMEMAKKAYAEQILRNVREEYNADRTLPLETCLCRVNHDMSDLLWAEAYMQNAKNIPK